MRSTTPALAAVFTLLLPFAARGEADDWRPFAPGERLEYTVSFGPFRVLGSGLLKVDGPVRRADQDSVLLSFDIEATIGGQRVSHHARSWLSTGRFASLAYEMSEQSPLGRGTARWEWRGPSASGGTSLPLDELSFI